MTSGNGSLETDFARQLKAAYTEVLIRLPDPAQDRGEVLLFALGPVPGTLDDPQYQFVAQQIIRLIERLPRSFSGEFQTSCVNMLRSVFSEEEIAKLLLLHCPQRLTQGERRVVTQFLVRRVGVSPELAVELLSDKPTRPRVGKYGIRNQRCEFAS